MRRQNNIARSAITAGLGLALTLTGIGTSPTRAHADTGTLTITQQHNAEATYDAYQLFKATISERDEATHVSWASDEMKEIVLAFIDANGYKDWLREHHPGDGQHDYAQCAAEFIASEIAGSETDTGAATTPRTTEARSFATRLAREIATKSPSSKKVAKTGEAFVDEEGYWLFVTTATTTGDSGETGTAPIWVPLGGSTSTIKEKSSAPTVDKEVWEDSSSSWGKVADANIDQDVAYRLSASLPANFAAYDSYHLQFTDALSEGLEIALPEGKELADVLVVRIGGQVVTLDGSQATASYQDNKLTVDFADLKDDCWKAFGIDHDSAITVEYPAHLTKAANMGAEGNANGVSLTYTNDPVSLGEGSIDPGPPTKIFAYRLELLKSDGQTNEALPGAQFTIQVSDDNSDEASRGLFVQADGSLAEEAATFTTGDDGSLSVPGIDEGSYLIRETVAPEGYEAIEGEIELTVSSSLEGTSLELGQLNALLSDEGAEVATVAAVDTSTGTIQLEIVDGKWLLMPLTGLRGIRESGVAGAGVALVSGCWLYARRRQVVAAPYSTH